MFRNSVGTVLVLAQASFIPEIVWKRYAQSNFAISTDTIMMAGLHGSAPIGGNGFVFREIAGTKPCPESGPRGSHMLMEAHVFAPVPTQTVLECLLRLRDYVVRSPSAAIRALYVMLMWRLPGVTG
jgi:hypothetical protein